MKADWLSDARQLPDAGMNELRPIAVRAVEETPSSPAVMAAIVGMSRSSLYEGWRGYRAGGEAVLAPRPAPGAPSVLTPIMEGWLEHTVLNSTPLDPGYAPVLWTRAIGAEVLNKHFGIGGSEAPVGLPLPRLDWSGQTPGSRAREQARANLAAFLAVTSPHSQRLAAKLGADRGFADEAGVGSRTRSGRTWGAVGQPPPLAGSDRRGSSTVLSISTATGAVRYGLEDQEMKGSRSVDLLRPLLSTRIRPVIRRAEQASFHPARGVHDFVRAHRPHRRLFCLPTPSPALNPAEPVWNELTPRRRGKPPIKHQADLNKRSRSLLQSLQRQAEKIQSFFPLPPTQYAAIPAAGT